MNPNIVRALAAFGAGALAGSVTTFFITKSVVRKAERAIADAEIASVREHYRIIRTDPSTLVTDEELAALEAENPDDDPPFEQGRGEDFRYDAPKDEAEVRELAELLEDAGYAKAQDIIGRVQDESISLREALAEGRAVVKTKVTVEESIFDKALEEAPDGQPRDTSRPYVISVAEYGNPEDDYQDYEYAEINYYAGDQIMLDSIEEIMFDVNEIVGVENLMFGRMSENEDIVYVRNDQLRLVFEIHRHEVGYAESKGLHVDPTQEDHYKTKRRQRPEDPDS